MELSCGSLRNRSLGGLGHFITDVCMSCILGVSRAEQ